MTADLDVGPVLVAACVTGFRCPSSQHQFPASCRVMMAQEKAWCSWEYEEVKYCEERERCCEKKHHEPRTCWLRSACAGVEYLRPENKYGNIILQLCVIYSTHCNIICQSVSPSVSSCH